MEVSKLVRRGEEGTCVNQDAESWNKLEPEICDMILEKLPSLERLRLRVVCKDWNCCALKRVERKPYFVTLTRKPFTSLQYLSGLVVYDVVSKSLSFEPLPFKLYHSYLPPFAVEGLIFTNLDQSLFIDVNNVSKNQWCVYNTHTRTKHAVPPAPRSDFNRGKYFCGMTVDTSIKLHTFKLVVSYTSGEESQIYDSTTRSWSSVKHPKSNPNSNSTSLLLAYGFCPWFFSMCHKGCMYICTLKAVDGVLVYSMEEDQWSRLSGSPFRGDWKRTYLGAWDDRIFAVLHDAGAKNVRVWELVDVIQQEWVKFARCSKAQYEQLMERHDFLGRCECEIVSVFSEEYMLMYNWHGGGSYVNTVLLNLKTKEWEFIPYRAVESENQGTGI